MKLTSLLSLTVLCGAATAGVVTMNIERNPASSGVSRRHPSKRDAITESLVNNITGGSYMASVSVGTPAQKLYLAIDTGSSDVWLLSKTADLCTSAADQAYYGSCETTFNAAKSSTFKVVEENGFDITYADQSGASGDYVTDDFTVGGATVRNLEMGIAYNSTVTTGLMGIGYDTNEAANSIYPNIIDDMVSQGLISAKAYSLYLDDLQSSTGSIIFGGLDSDKYHGSLVELPVAAEHLRNGSQIYAAFAVALTSLSVTSSNGSTVELDNGGVAEAVILDSGTTLTYLPDYLAASLFFEIGAYDDTANSGNVYVDCNMRTKNSSMTIDYGFGGASSGATVKVSISELIFDLNGIFSLYPDTRLPSNLPFSQSDTCALGIQSGGGTNLLGDTFLRSAYVVYDLDNDKVAIAQTNFNSTTSSIVQFTAGQTSIPNASGVASSVSVTATATGAQGAGAGGKASSTAQTSSTSSASASASKSAATNSAPVLDLSGFVLLSIAGLLAVAGGSWFLA
ncbi:hypothetical protein BP6252_05488 [Coleophoma cylindrospora]|uniref:Peptidase A1 domain-containing protein n=1 Tax=Coleophoma cylindrospora TaxID=1849047 RepID=A0A3D8RTV2_9HELO|nr:hypothetical protein BP6252_05488 [Coleophoma cylindrospora]